MPNMTKLSEILGVQKKTPEVGGIFQQDAEENRAAEARQRKDEFGRYAKTTAAEVAAAVTQPRGAVRRTPRHLVEPDGSGGFQSIDPAKVTAYDMSSQAVRRSGSVNDVQSPAVSFRSIKDMGLFDSPEAYERRFEDMKTASERRRIEAQRKRELADKRRTAWERSYIDDLQRTIDDSGGQVDPRTMMGGGAIRLSGVADVAAGNFGVIDQAAMEERSGQHERMRQARQARKEAIGRTQSDRPSVNEQLASKMQSRSAQQQSAENGLAAKLMQMAMQNGSQGE